jgi:hypothetical protein
VPGFEDEVARAHEAKSTDQKWKKLAWEMELVVLEAAEDCGYVVEVQGEFDESGVDEPEEVEDAEVFEDCFESNEY